MLKTVRRNLWLSQICLATFFLICFALLPSVLRNNGGASNFGNALPAMIPYILAFLSSSVCLAAAASQLSQMSPVAKRSAAAILGIIVLELLVMLTTFGRKANQVYYLAHDYLGAALYLYNLALSVWILVKTRSPITAAFLLLEAIGSTIALLSLLGATSFLFLGQMIGAAGFGLLLASGLPRAVEKDLASNCRNRDHASRETDSASS